LKREGVESVEDLVDRLLPPEPDVNSVETAHGIVGADSDAASRKAVLFQIWLDTRRWKQLEFKEREESLQTLPSQVVGSDAAEVLRLCARRRMGSAAEVRLRAGITAAQKAILTSCHTQGIRNADSLTRRVFREEVQSTQHALVESCRLQGVDSAEALRQRLLPPDPARVLGSNSFEGGSVTSYRLNAWLVEGAYLGNVASLNELARIWKNLRNWRGQASGAGKSGGTDARSQGK
jgi:hypothetical protein